MNPVERGKITLDVWRASGATRAGIETRQRQRLAEMRSFVRGQSRFYKRHYADVSEGSTDLTQYPPVTKPMLMEHFDDVVTDTAITRTEIDAFVADETKIGERFIGRYPVWTTSGRTGEPGVFVQDETAWTISDVLGDRWIVPALVGISPLSKLVTQNLRIGLVAVSGEHFAGAAGLEMMRRESIYGERPWRVSTIEVGTIAVSLHPNTSETEAFDGSSPFEDVFGATTSNTAVTTSFSRVARRRP